MRRMFSLVHMVSQAQVCGAINSFKVDGLSKVTPTVYWLMPIGTESSVGDSATLHCAGARFAVDVKDSRFDALFTSPDFALDPTDPRYKATEGAQSIQEEAVSRRGAIPVVKKKMEGLSTKPQVSSTGLSKSGYKY